MKHQLDPGLVRKLRAALWVGSLTLCSGVFFGASAADRPAAHPSAPASTPASAPALASASAPTHAHAPDGQDIAAKKVPVDSLPTSSTNPMAEKIRAAMAGTVVFSKKMTVTVESKEPAAPALRVTQPGHAATPSSRSTAAKRYSQARNTALTGHASGNAHATENKVHGGEAHWSYEGETGPQAWGQLKPEFNLCAIGKRQSPINIEEGSTLQGPAEPVKFAYAPSNGTVINNGHTIQVDVQGENSITVRGSNYRLLQFHFHTPSEEQVNSKHYPMVAHLVHKNTEGQLAVVAVLLEPGEANPLIDKVWTYMPLDTNDRVNMPMDLLNLNELLPTDQRYYQFIGSLTTPPCTEGVLWMVLKQPVSIGKSQYKLFTQLYPNNARPVQPVNGRPVRDAQ